MPLSTPFTGRRSDVGFTKEASRGTTASTVEYWIPYASFSFVEKVQKVRDETGLGSIEQPRTADLVKRWSEGDIEFNLRDQSIGLILLSLFGTETYVASTPQAGCGQHTFTIAASNQHQALDVWQKDPVQTLQAGSCMVSSFAIKAVLDQYVRANVGLIGKVFGVDSATVAYVAENRFRPQDITIKLAATANELSAASAITTVRSFNLNVNKNVEDFQGLGSVDPVDFVNKDVQVSGDFEIAFESAAYKNLTLGNDFRAMSFKVANSGVIIGTSTNPSLEVILDQVDFDNFDIDRSNENLVVLTANFTGHYSQANSRMLRAILINSKTAEY